MCHQLLLGLEEDFRAWKDGFVKQVFPVLKGETEKVELKTSSKGCGTSCTCVKETGSESGVCVHEEDRQGEGHEVRAGHLEECSFVALFPGIIPRLGTRLVISLVCESTAAIFLMVTTSPVRNGHLSESCRGSLSCEW